MTAEESLTLRDSIRKRPGMYIGDSTGLGLRFMFRELLTDVLDDAKSPPVITMTLTSDGAVVIDYVTDVPAFYADDGATSVVESMLATPGYPGKRIWNGVCVAIALASSAVVDIYDSGKHLQQYFDRGLPTTALRVVGSTARQGMALRVVPDPAHFPNPRLAYHPLCGQVRDLAILHSCARIRIDDESSGSRMDFHYQEGIKSYLEELLYTKIKSPADLIVLRSDEGAIKVECAMMSCYYCPSTIHSFANNDRCYAGGSHVRGFTQAYRDVAQEKDKICKEEYVGTLTNHNGGVCVISVRVPMPHWTGSTKDCLDMPDVEKAVYNLVKPEFAKRLPG